MAMSGARSAGASAEVTGLVAGALEWYAACGRNLAFRRTRDAWAVLVAEVMAQQTQASRAAEAWTTFIDRYPTPMAFAKATPAEAIRIWRGLGYNRRAIALRAAAGRIVEDHDGRVPDDLRALEALPGIGPYTARAVLAIAFGRAVAALDTNILRVLERAAGPLPIASIERQAAADRLVPRGRAAAWTNALMDIGAIFCRTFQPRCADCPLAGTCAFALSASPAAPRVREPGQHAPAFASTARWLRGRILDRLRDVPDGEWATFDSPIGEHDVDALRTAAASMARQGLIEIELDGPLRARLPP